MDRTIEYDDYLLTHPSLYLSLCVGHASLKDTIRKCPMFRKTLA